MNLCVFVDPAPSSSPFIESCLTSDIISSTKISIAQDVHGLTFARTPQQNLNILFLASAAAPFHFLLLGSCASREPQYLSASLYHAGQPGRDGEVPSTHACTLQSIPTFLTTESSRLRIVQYMCRRLTKQLKRIMHALRTCAAYYRACFSPTALGARSPSPAISTAPPPPCKTGQPTPHSPRKCGACCEVLSSFKFLNALPFCSGYRCPVTAKLHDHFPSTSMQLCTVSTGARFGCRHHPAAHHCCWADLGRGPAAADGGRGRSP